jgi:hypothetical protein
MTFRSTIAAVAMLAVHPVAAQDHRFETDPIASVRENFVACDVLSQLQRVMENPRFLLGGECVPLRAGDRFYALTLMRLIKPPITEKEIVAKEKDVKRLRHRLGLRKWCQLYAGEMAQARILIEALRRQN